MDEGLSIMQAIILLEGSLNVPGCTFLRGSGMEAGGVTLLGSTISFLEEEGLITVDIDKEGYFVTDKGLALVDAWLSTPLPEPCWRIPSAAAK